MNVVIDSSVWIDFFRGEKKVVSRVDTLLADDRAVIAGPIFAEVVSGALTLASFHQLRARLRSLHALPEPTDLWERVAEARFTLARLGFQAHLVDLVIAVSASVQGCALLTRDKDFVAIARVVPLDVDVC